MTEHEAMKEVRNDDKTIHFLLSKKDEICHAGVAVLFKHPITQEQFSKFIEKLTKLYPIMISIKDTSASCWIALDKNITGEQLNMFYDFLDPIDSVQSLCLMHLFMFCDYLKERKRIMTNESNNEYYIKA